jgi:hypothetical protein
LGHVLVENRNGLVVNAEPSRVSGHAERMATVGADREFDTRNFVEDLRKFGATPYIAQNTAGRRSTAGRRGTPVTRLV